MTTDISEIRLDEINMLAMSQVVEYIYNGRLRLCGTAVYDILYIAKTLMIKSLREKCEDFISAPMQTVNATNNDSDTDVDVDDLYEPEVSVPESKPVVHAPQIQTRRSSRRKKKVKSEKIEPPPEPDGEVIDILPSKRVKKSRVSAKQIRIIKEDDGFRCPECHKFYISLHSLKAHMKIHDEQVRQHCSTCHKAFTRTQHLLEHEQTHLKVRTHACEVCGKFLSSARNLRRHAALHDDNKTFDCLPCSLGFKTELELAEHRRSHSDYKYVCSICGDRYQYKSRLEVHLKCHRPTRDSQMFCCDVCGSTYKSRYQLKDHMTLHSEERPYTCTICKKSFRLQRHYQSHLDLHNNGKRFICPICGISYSQSMSLKKHARSVHGDDIGNILHQCNICKKSFHNIRKFKIHCRTHLTKEAKAIPLGYAPHDRDNHIDIISAPLQNAVDDHQDIPQSLPLPAPEAPPPSLTPLHAMTVTSVSGTSTAPIHAAANTALHTVTTTPLPPHQPAMLPNTQQLQEHTQMILMQPLSQSEIPAPPQSLSQIIVPPQSLHEGNPVQHHVSINSAGHPTSMPPPPVQSPIFVQSDISGTQQVTELAVHPDIQHHAHPIRILSDGTQIPGGHLVYDSTSRVTYTHVQQT